MKNWLKFFFLGFFNDKYGKEAAKRSFFNVLLSLLLAIVLISGGITAGYAASFSKHYNNADSFREFLYAAFASGNDSRINLKIQDGKLSAETPSGDSLNGFIDDVIYSVNGYKLIVDTNPSATSFDDFTLECKDANGIEISYEDYRKLPETGQKNGSVVFKYSGKPLDVTAKQTEYITYLDNITNEANGAYSGEVAKSYRELNNKKNSGEISDKEYANEVYVLYAKNYYPSYSQIETFGDAPTLRTYYTQAQLIENEDKYLIILDDTFICSFTTEDGMTVNFASYYMGVADSVISSQDLSVGDMHANIDRFVAKCFTGSSGLIFFVYIINTGNLLWLLALIILFLALIAFALSRFLHLEFGANYYKAVKIVGSYMFYSAVFAFLLAFILSFFCVRGTVFSVTEIAFACVLVVRSAILFVTEIVRKKRGLDINAKQPAPATDADTQTPQ